MRLKKAQEYVEKALPVLVKHIRENYYPDFVAPEIEFNNSWKPHIFAAFYHFRKKYYEYDGKIEILRESRVCLTELADTLTHELGHALLDQVNPEFCYVNLKDEGYASLCEGIAGILQEEGINVLKEKGLFSDSLLNDLRIGLNQLFNPLYLLSLLRGIGRKYNKGEKAVTELKKKHSLVDIMKQAHDSQFAGSSIKRK